MVIDNEDDQADAYIKKYGREHVVIFDKQAVDDWTDTADNFHEHRAIIYARNQSFYIAQDVALNTSLCWMMIIPALTTDILTMGC